MSFFVFCRINRSITNLVDNYLDKWYKEFTQKIKYFEKKEGYMTITEEIENLKQKLDKEIENNAPYEQILKTSKDIDVLLAKYYLEEVK